MNKTKTLKLMVLSLLTLSLLVGCGTKSTTDNKETKSSDSKFRVGISQYAPHGSLDNCREGFIAGLADSGFIEGDNLEIDYQNASGEAANASMIADTFVSKQYDLICGIATPTAMAAFNAAVNTNIPVIFTAVSDPVAAELVDSLEKPGKNSTGTSDALPLEEQMKMIREFMPEAKTIGILYTTSEVNSLTHLAAFEALAPSYGFEIKAIGVNTAADIPLAVDTLLTKVDVINNFTDNNVVTNLETLLSKANEVGIPVFGSEEEQVLKGCVAAQNIDYFELGRDTGKIAAKVLNGESASVIPVSVISECTPVVNESAMELLGLTLPAEYKDTVTYLSAE